MIDGKLANGLLRAWAEGHPAHQLGRQNPLYFEVLEGLEPGELVITSSYDTFGENDKLILKE